MWETTTPVIRFQNREYFVLLLPEQQNVFRAQSEYPEQKLFIKVRFGITRIGLTRNRTSRATETGKFIFEHCLKWQPLLQLSRSDNLKTRKKC